MAAPQISPLPTPPSRADSPSTFTERADDFLGALPQFQAQANTQADFTDQRAATAEQRASAAADSAAAAATSAAGAASSAGAAAASAAGASNSAGAAAASAIGAAGSASGAASSAGTASTKAAEAAGSAGTASTKAAEAVAAATAAASAVLGQTTSKLDLAAIDQTVFASTTLSDAVIYDTSKDSDGGAWRKRTQNTSWYNETIYGKWLGSAASETAARAISGATTGDYYFDTTSNKFFSLNATSGRTETFRGNVREFPARVLITVENTTSFNRLVIWDMTQPGCPMWMVFIIGGAWTSWTNNTLNLLTDSNGLHGGEARNGEAVFAHSGKGILRINFLADTGKYQSVSLRKIYGGGIGARNSQRGLVIDALGLEPIVSGAVNDVAMTVLPAAPIDPATGLPVPTIAVATDGGVSVIKHDGAVANVVPASVDYRYVKSVRFTGEGRLGFTLSYQGLSDANLNHIIDLPSASISDLAFNSAYAPLRGELYRVHASAPSIPMPLKPGNYATALGATAWTADEIGADSGLTRLHRNPASPTRGMVAYAANGYGSGWLPGDIRGAWINRADGVAEALTDTELVTNGTFGNDTSGWSAQLGTISVESGELKLQSTGLAYAQARQAITLTPGKAYRATVTGRKGTDIGWVLLGSSGYGTQDYSGTALIFNSTPPTKKSVDFVATASTLYVAVQTNNVVAGGTLYIDEISVREIVVDRSAKNIGLAVKGTLSSTPVAAGAGLGAVSGFSLANYLEHPYSSDLDFGSAAFAFLVPLKEASNTSDEVVFERAYYTGGAYSGARIRLEVLAAGTLKATFTDGTNAVTLTSSSAIDDATWRTGLVVGFDGTNFRLVGAGGRDLAAPIARGSVGSLSNGSAVLRVGLGVDGALPLTNGSLALLRATAMWPSADQLAYIYETERKLFEPNAQCALAGTSNAVTALAYDEGTDLLHVGTSWGRSAFQGLLRVASEATPVGSIKAMAASGGAVAQVGASAVDIYVPAYSLREELKRLDAAARAFGSPPVFHEFDAVAAQTAFVLPIGFRVVGVYSAGALKRNGSTKDYTLAFDGFRWTVNFAVAPGAGAWVSIMTVRA